MQNFSKIIISIQALICNTLCEETSFFLNDEDSKKALIYAKQQSDTQQEIKDSHNFKLSGIFFIDDQNWTVWINDKPYSTIGIHGDFSIDEVNEQYVTVTTSDGDTVTLTVD